MSVSVDVQRDDYAANLAPCAEYGPTTVTLEDVDVKVLGVNLHENAALTYLIESVESLESVDSTYPLPAVTP